MTAVAAGRTVGPPTLDVRVAHSARVYNYFLGGKDYYPADRELAEVLYQVTPGVVTAARVHRAFIRRVAGWMAAEGLGQFVDVGTGLPDSPNLHEVVQKARPTARVLYVDPDPLVLLHARALLTSVPEGVTAYLDTGILEHGADRLDPEPFLVPVDIVDDYRRGRSSSAAKKADADFKISFARRSSRFSRSSWASRSATSLGTPGRVPASTSAFATHTRSVSGEIPSCAPIR